jgi:hypothetical protein
MRLAAWIAQLGYFNEINFIFLVVGHMKNAADHLFNSLKIQYRKKNLYTFNQLREALSSSRTITIHPTVSEDFLYYTKLLELLYKKLTGHIKQNHIFSTAAHQGDEIRVRESVLQNEDNIFKIMKKYYLSLLYTGEGDCGRRMMMLEWEGINPYKVYELFKHYRPYVPVEYQLDPIYAEPSPEVLAKVKAEKVDRMEFRATLKKKKYDRKKANLENVVFGDDDDKAHGVGM